jgi:hypothetical protein
MMSMRMMAAALAVLTTMPTARADDAKDEKGCVYADLTYSIGAVICVGRSNIALRCVPGGSQRQGGLSPSAPFWDSSVPNWPVGTSDRQCIIPQIAR